MWPEVHLPAACDRQILVVENGPEAGQEIVLAYGQTYTVGRAPDAHVRLPREDDLASRYHAVLEASTAGVEVRDLKSRNGTFVNGKAQVLALLRPGDRVRLGHTVLHMIHPAARELGADPFDLDWIDEELARQSLMSSSPGGAFLGLGPTALRVDVPADAAQASMAGCDGCGKRSPVPLPPPFTGLGYLCDACAAARFKIDAFTPHSLGEFEILRIIGRGGMGLVYEARHRVSHGHAAIKTLRPDVELDEVLVRRFLSEQRRAVGLFHPHIVRCVDVGKDERTGDFYIATEWLAGGDASELGSSRFSLELALTLGADLFEAIAYLTARGLVHRDIKPANLLLAPPGRAKIAGKLADFGISRNLKEAGSRITADSEMAGTPLFAAPEQLVDFKWVGHTTDLYGGAATIYFLISGDSPLSLPSKLDELPHIAVLTAALENDRIPAAARRPDAPRELCDWLDRALARDPREREQMDAAKIATWLRALANG